MTNQTGGLVDEMVKKPCAFILSIARPLETHTEILKMFMERSVRVITMSLHMLGKEEASLIIHCMIERDRAKYIMQLLEKMKGMRELELLEGKANNLKLFKHVDG